MSSNKILIMYTNSTDLRSLAFDWEAENPANVWQAFSSLTESHPGKVNTIHDVPIELVERGVVKGYDYSFPTPLHAMASGWKLLGPPSKEMRESISTMETTECVKWWFVT